MNKKLIKKLQSVGFERNQAWLSIILNGEEIYYFYMLGGDLHICETGFSKQGLTFVQILAAIKEHTGVDLQPKKTLEQRIETLEQRSRGNKKVIYEGVDSLKEWKTKPERTENIEPYERKETRKVQDLNHLKSEQLVFKVGDEVVIVREVNEEMSLDLANAIKKQEVLKISRFDLEINCFCIPIKGSTYYFTADKLRHASKKELKFGGWAELLSGCSSETGYCKGQRVLIIDDKEAPNFEVVLNGHDSRWLKEEDLKPL